MHIARKVQVSVVRFWVEAGFEALTSIPYKFSVNKTPKSRPK